MKVSRKYFINVVAWLYFTTTAVAFSCYMASHWEVRFTPVGLLLGLLTLMYLPLSVLSFQQILPRNSTRPFKTDIEFSPKVANAIRFAALVLPTQMVGYIFLYGVTICSTPCQEIAIGHAPHVANTCMLASCTKEHRYWCLQNITDKTAIAHWLSPEALIKCERAMFGDKGAFIVERAFAFKYGYTGDYACSEDFWTKALADCRKAYSPNSAKEHDCLAALGNTQFAARKYLDAESSYLDALEIRKKTHGDCHPKTARDMARLGALYDKMLRFGDADRYYKAAEAIVPVSANPGMIKIARGHAQRLSCLIEETETAKYKWASEIFPHSPRKFLWSREFVEIPTADYKLLSDRQNAVLSGFSFPAKL